MIDARNALDPVPWREAGWEYRALGVAEDTVARTRLDASPCGTRAPGQMH